MEPACLGDESIAALVEGRLEGARGEAARAHLARCAECRRLVSATVAALSAGDTAPRDLHDVSRGGTSSSLSVGALLADNYRVERLLGEGGMGRVVVARQLKLDRLVAIKVLHPEVAEDLIALQRFQREAKLIASIKSEHVVNVHDFGVSPSGEPFLVMELLEGEDLAAVVARGPVEPALAVAWVRAATEAIAEAHALGVVHRDLKPGNLFLTRAGKIKVIDFGLAKRIRRPDAPRGGSLDGMTHAGELLGSPQYMAPEQILEARDVDARADVWSLGATLFHLLRGVPPFAQTTLDSVFASILSGWGPPLDSLPAPLAEVIRRAMARDAAARYPNAGALLHALDIAQRELPRALAVAAPLPQMSASPRKMSRWPWALGGAALVGIFAAVAMRRPAEQAQIDAPGDPEQARQPSAPASQPRRDVEEGPPARASLFDNLDAARLQQRATKLGWKTALISRDAFPGCVHTRLALQRADDGIDSTFADVYLLECDGPEMAQSERKRLRRGFPKAWFTLDQAHLLMVQGADEQRSRTLSDALLGP